MRIKQTIFSLLFVVMFCSCSKEVGDCTFSPHVGRSIVVTCSGGNTIRERKFPSSYSLCRWVHKHPNYTCEELFKDK